MLVGLHASEPSLRHYSVFPFDLREMSQSLLEVELNACRKPNITTWFGGLFNNFIAFSDSVLSV